MSTLHTIYPQSSKAEYTENDSIDFNLSYLDALVPNSITLTGNIEVSPLGAGNVFYDGICGLHNFVSSWNIQLDKLGFIENIQEYPRYFKQRYNARQTIEQQFSESDKTTEWRCDTQQSKYILQGLTGSKPLPFSLRPFIALNKMSAPLPNSKSGAVRINCRLSQNIDCIFGADSANAVFKITNLQMNYQTTVLFDLGPVDLMVVSMIRNTVASANHTISTKVPLQAVKSVSGSFIKSANLSQTTTNNVELETLPNLTKVEFQLADNNGYLSYPLLSREEILYNYIQANGNSRHNAIRLDKLKQGKSFGYGLVFPRPYDLSKNKISINLSSDASNVNQYTTYLYFTAVIKV